MSASIYWRTTSKGKSLDIGLPSGFIVAMRKAFGEHSRWLLKSDDLERLRGMAAAGAEVNELIRQLEEHGEIEVWAEW